MDSARDNSNPEQIPAQLFRDIVDSTPNPVVIFRRDGLQKYANRSAESLFGHFDNIFDLVSDSVDQDSLKKQVDSKNKNPDLVLPYSLEVEICCADNMHRSFELKSRKINNDSEFLIAIFRNIDSEKQRHRELHRQAVTDFLSGLPNRRQFRAILDSQAGQDVCLAIVDVDHFKQTNDRHGHLVGDRAIRLVARQLMECFDDAICVSRLGGDEFCVLLRQTDVPTAVQQFEEFRARIDQLKLTDEGSGLTVSIGVANSFTGWDWHGLMARADQALYQAKENGRNQVVAYKEKK